MRRGCTISQAMSLMIIAVIIALGAALVDSQASGLPACYSVEAAGTYINSDITIPVQPSSPVLVSRYQAPLIRIFCIEFIETGPTCTGSAPPILCSRPVNDPSQSFNCDYLTQYTTQVNTFMEFGSISGPDMYWDLLWDGTAEPLSCYPRTINFRALILVSSNTTSTAVLVIMVIIAFIGFLLIVFVVIWVLCERFQRIDEAGAVTIGGPKPSFTGPQLAVGPNMAPLGDGVDKVYLPVDENGATVADQSAEFGQLVAASRVMGTPAQRAPRGPRRASPPAPGDGLPGGTTAFRGAQRSALGINTSEDEFDDETQQKRITRRRRRQSPSRNDDLKLGTIFPIEESWNTNADFREEYIDDEGNEVPVEEARRRGMRPPRPFNMPEQRVKYIPQWQMGSFGKGGLIPELGDGHAEEMDEVKDLENREFGKERRPVKTFGRYRTTLDAPHNRRGLESGEDTEGSDYPMEGRRRSRRSPYGRGDESEGRRTVRFIESGNELADDAYGTDGPSGPPLRRRRRASQTGRDFNPDVGLSEGASDNFNRGAATVFSPKLNLRKNSAVAGGPRRDSNDGAGDAPDDAKENTFSYRREGPPPVLQCAQCKALLGTGSDEQFCPVDGHRHF